MTYLIEHFKAVQTRLSFSRSPDNYFKTITIIKILLLQISPKKAKE